MQAREGDPLRLFLGLLEPVDETEWIKAGSNRPADGDESLFIGSRVAASVFAGGRTISDGGGEGDAPQRMLPPAA